MSKNAGGFVKITGGEFRGQKIATPGGDTHPMGERERIALFNMIGEHIGGNFVMDLYCGGGTLGIEALSRGAAFVVFIDINKEATDVVKENMKKLGLYGIRGGEVQADISIIARTATDRYGILIADPPYDQYEEKMVKYLPRMLFDGGILALSHPGEAPELNGMTLLKSKKYAAAHISIYVKGDEIRSPATFGPFFR